MAGQTLFEKYGGFSSVSRIVLAFYDALLDNDELGDFFDGIDISRLVDHQTKFVASLMGGPASYSDKQIRQLHAHLDINDGHFDELKVVLADVLTAHSVSDDDIEAILAAFEERRAQVVWNEHVN